MRLSIMPKLLSPLYLRAGALYVTPAMFDGIVFRPHVRCLSFCFEANVGRLGRVHDLGPNFERNGRSVAQVGDLDYAIRRGG